MADERIPPTIKLPRGLWYERKHRRYRVRLYRKGKAYLAGYYRTEQEGRRALDELKKRLNNESYT